MGWDILLFDLDGTLTDSGPGIMHAAKTALQSFGIDGLSEQELRYFVGPPLWESFGKYLPEEQISAAIDRFREEGQTDKARLLSRRAGMPAGAAGRGQADVRRDFEARDHGAAGAGAF